MPYKALTRVGLPQQVEREVHPGVVVNVPSGVTDYKEPGDKITKAELTEHGQTEDDISRMIADNEISEDMDAPLHPDSVPHDPLAVVVSADDVEGETNE